MKSNATNFTHYLTCLIYITELTNRTRHANLRDHIDFISVPTRNTYGILESYSTDFTKYPSELTDLTDHADLTEELSELTDLISLSRLMDLADSTEFTELAELDDPEQFPDHTDILIL